MDTLTRGQLIYPQLLFLLNYSPQITVRFSSFSIKQQIKHLHSSLFVLWSMLKKEALHSPFLNKKLKNEQSGTRFKLFYYNYFFIFLMWRNNPPDGISTEPCGPTMLHQMLLEASVAEKHLPASYPDYSDVEKSQRFIPFFHHNFLLLG